MSATALLDTSGPSMEEMSPEEDCELCGGIFPDARRLFRHFFNDHELSKEKIDEIKIRRRIKAVTKKASGKSRAVYICEFCQKPYLSKLGLVAHKEREHNQVRVTLASTDNIVCPLPTCGARFQTYFDLATHADDVHRTEHDPEAFRIHRVRFPDFDMFVDWRGKQERATSSRFFTRSTETKIRYAKKVWLLKCYHTQKKRSFNSAGYPPHLGTIHCPAFIRVCERFSGEVEAVACFGHLGHGHNGQTMVPSHSSHQSHLNLNHLAVYEEEEEEEGPMEKKPMLGVDVHNYHLQPAVEEQQVVDEHEQQYIYEEDADQDLEDGEELLEEDLDVEDRTDSAI